MTNRRLIVQTAKTKRDKQRAEVAELSVQCIPDVQIAARLGCSVRTVMRRRREQEAVWGEEFKVSALENQVRLIAHYQKVIREGWIAWIKSDGLPAHMANIIKATDSLAKVMGIFAADKHLHEHFHEGDKNLNLDLSKASDASIMEVRLAVERMMLEANGEEPEGGNGQVIDVELEQDEKDG